jgi:GNAT superfamily N-acetyltransferase
LSTGTGGWNELLFWTDIKPLNITILEQGGERVGFFDIHREEEVLRLRNIQLRRDFHGRGVGRWMLERVEEEALRTGARRIALSVFLDNPAVGFYEKLGFTEVSRKGSVLAMEKPVRGAV